MIPLCAIKSHFPLKKGQNNYSVMLYMCSKITECHLPLITKLIYCTQLISVSTDSKRHETLSNNKTQIN